MFKTLALKMSSIGRNYKNLGTGKRIAWIGVGVLILAVLIGFIYYRLAYRDPTRPQAYALSHWVMSPAALLGQRLRASIARASTAGVFVPADGVRAAYTLRLELEEFSQVFDAADRSRAVLRLRASLIGQRNIVAQQGFNLEHAAATPNAEGGVRALIAASDAAGEKLVDWLAANMK